MKLADEQEVKTFYAMRPEWMDSDEERQQFAEQNPELVERFSDCWEDYTNCLPQVAMAQA